MMKVRYRFFLSYGRSCPLSFTAFVCAFQRTAGRPSKYTFDVNAIVAAMSNVSGDQNDLQKVE